MGLRTPFALPSFKPLSRTSSPAPLTPNTTGAPTSPPKEKATLRSLSGRGLTRGRADVPPTSFDEPADKDGLSKRSRSLSRPLKILNMSSSSRPPTPGATPLGTPNPSPKMPGTPLPGSGVGVSHAGANGVTTLAGAGIGQQADASSYMEAVGLRLSESVGKALTGTAGAGDFKGRKGLVRGSGRELGGMVIKEFPAPPIDMYVLRAIVRTTVKHLSVFATRIETVLLPAVLDPTFSHPILSPPLPPSSMTSLPLTQSSSASSHANPFNPCQTYTLTLAHSALELRSELSAHLIRGSSSSFLDNNNGGQPYFPLNEPWPKFVHDAYKPVLEKLDSIVNRVVQPLLATIKRELIGTLDGLSKPMAPPPLHHHATSMAKTAAGTVLPTLKAGAKSLSSPFPSPLPSPSLGGFGGSNGGSGGGGGLGGGGIGSGIGGGLGSFPGGGVAPSIPPALSVFAARIDPARKALAKLTAGAGESGEGWIVGIVVGIIWRGMVGIVERPHVGPGGGLGGGGGGGMGMGGNHAVGSVSTGGGDETTTTKRAGSPKLLGQRKLTSVLSETSLSSSSLSKGGLGASSRPNSPPHHHHAYGGPGGSVDMTNSYSHSSTSTINHGSGSGSAGTLSNHHPTNEIQTHLISSFHHLVRRLLVDLIPIPQIPIPSPNSKTVTTTTTLAQEALAEALEALYSLHLILATLARVEGLDLIERALKDLKEESSTASSTSSEGGGGNGQGEELLDALDDVPPVLLLHLFAGRLSALSSSSLASSSFSGSPSGSGGGGGGGVGSVGGGSSSFSSTGLLPLRPMHDILGWTKDQYQATVLAGFAAAEAWEEKVGIAVGREVDWVLAKSAGIINNNNKVPASSSSSASPPYASSASSSSSSWVAGVQCGSGEKRLLLVLKGVVDII